jgi:hypothetical protein
VGQYSKLSAKAIRTHVKNMERLQIVHTRIGLTRKAKQVSDNLREARSELSKRR